MASDTLGDDGRAPSLERDAAEAAESTLIHGAPALIPPAISATLQAAFRQSRYRPRRLHAHGGLGEVYEADDLELGRAVALKRMRDARGQRDSDRERFRREAEITGRLEHPGVVPIYGLGCDAAGQPFYAMRFIRGETLAQAIDAFHGGQPLPPSPLPQSRERGEDAKFDSLAFRRLLQRFIAACNAVAFAHSHGIIHRDLKPANIMLGDFGETHVVDWGLAKQVGESTPVPAAGRRTTAFAASRPGEGTIATEQSTVPPNPPPGALSGSGDSAPTEIGTVLGTPAFMSPEQASGQWDEVGAASDIFSLGATLYVMLTGRAAYRGELSVVDAVEWRFTRPRSIKPEIPPELEAICLKAMARKPEQRYASALDLAADIEKWMAQEPVAVFREPWTKRAGRWVKRHRTLVSTVGAALAVAVVILAVGSILLNAARRGEGAAKQQAEQLAADNARQRDEALAKYQLARRAVDEMLTAVSVKLRTVQDVPAVRRQLLQQALVFYEQFLQERTDDPQLRRETASAFVRAAGIHEMLGENVKSEEEFRKGIALWGELAAQFPDEPADRYKLAEAQNGLGSLLSQLSRTEEAERAYLEARRLHLQLVEGDPTAAKYRNDLAANMHDLARLLSSTARTAEAEKMYSDALAIRKKVAAENPDVARYQDGLARTQSSLAAVLSGTTKSAQAEQLLRDASQAWRKLSTRYPDDVDYRESLALCLNNLASFYADTSRFREAIKIYTEGFQIQESLIESFPTVPSYRERYGAAAQQCGNMLRRIGKPLEAEAQLKIAVKTWEKLVADFPDVPSHQTNLASAYGSMGLTLAALLREEEAIDHYQRAIALLDKLIARYPNRQGIRFELYDTYNSLGLLHFGADRWDEAEKCYLKAIEGADQLVKEFPDELFGIQVGAIASSNLGDVDLARGRPEASLPRFAKAIAALTPVVTRDSRLTIARQFLSYAHWGRARTLAALGRHDDAKPDWERALALALDGDKTAIRIGWVASKFGRNPDEKPKEKKP